MRTGGVDVSAALLAMSTSLVLILVVRGELTHPILAPTQPQSPNFDILEILVLDT